MHTIERKRRYVPSFLDDVTTTKHKWRHITSLVNIRVASTKHFPTQVLTLIWGVKKKRPLSGKYLKKKDEKLKIKIEKLINWRLLYPKVIRNDKQSKKAESDGESHTHGAWLWRMCRWLTLTRSCNVLRMILMLTWQKSRHKKLSTNFI